MEFLLGMALSAHMGLEGSYNAVHPHARLEFDNNVVAGAYYNSEENMSVYAGYRLEKDSLFAEAGAVTGYDAISPVLPYARVGIDMNNGFSVFGAPAFEENLSGDIKTGAVVGVEYMFNFSK